MKISFDPAKRDKTLKERGLDFADAAEIFAGHGETRVQTYGLLRDRLVVVIWTERGAARHVISMRKCNEREEKKFRERLGQAG